MKKAKIHPNYVTAEYEDTFIWTPALSVLEAVRELPKYRRSDKVFLRAWLSLIFPEIRPWVKEWILKEEL